MKPDDLKRWKQQYHGAKDAAAEVLAEALCITFKEITNRDPSDKCREAIFDAVSYE